MFDLLWNAALSPSKNVNPALANWNADHEGSSLVIALPSADQSRD